MGNGQWTMDDGRWTVDNGQLMLILCSEATENLKINY